MTFCSRTVLLRAALLAFAAGCGSTVERERAVGSSSSEDAASSSASGDDGAGAGLAGDGDGDGDGDGGAGGDGGGGGGGEGPAPSSVCPSATFSGTAADAIAVTWSDDAASLVLRDGSLIALELPPASPPPDERAYVSVAIGADRVAVSRGWNTFGNVPAASSTVRWFDRRGALLEELSSEDGFWASSIGPEGTTVLQRTIEPWNEVVRLADGTLRDLEDLDVIGEPLVSGWLRAIDLGTSRALFVNPTTLERRELDTEQYPVLVDDGVAWLEPGDGEPILAHATPDATERTVLRGAAGAFASMYLAAVPRSPWALLTDGESRNMWRIDWRTGDVAAIDAPPPAGRSMLDDSCDLARPVLLSTGDVAAGLRTGGDGQAAVASVSGGWQLLGAPFAQPGVFGIVETAGTLVVTAGGPNDTFCPIVDWTEPPSPEALGVDRVQIVRPAVGITHVLEGVDPWSVGPSHDGGCVTFTRGAIEGELVRSVMDVELGEARELPGQSFAWIP